MHAAMGSLDLALDVALLAQEIYQHLGDHKGEVKICHNMVALHKEVNELSEAFNKASSALSIARTQSRDRLLEARCLSVVADVHLEMGQTQEAQYRSRDAQEIFSELRDKKGEAGVLHTWMKAQAAENKPSQAQDTCHEIVDLFRNGGDKAEEAKWLMEAARLHLRYNQPSEAARVAGMAQALFTQLVKNVEAETAGELIKTAKTEELSDIIRGVLHETRHERHQQEFVIAPGLDRDIQAQLMKLAGMT